MSYSLWLIISIVTSEINYPVLFCKIRDNKCVPKIFLFLLKYIFENKAWFSIRKEEMKNRCILFFIILGINLIVLVFGQFGMHKMEGCLLIVALLSLYRYNPINVPMLFYFTLEFILVTSVMVLVWTSNIIVLISMLMNDEIDLANKYMIGWLLCVVLIYSLFSIKWKRYLGHWKTIMGKVIFVLNVFMILFSFGAMNLVYATPDKYQLSETLEKDSVIMYTGRFVYAGSIPAIYGKDIMKKKNETVKDLSQIYERCYSLSFSELLVLEEMLFMMAYVYMSFSLKFDENKKS